MLTDISWTIHLAILQISANMARNDMTHFFKTYYHDQYQRTIYQEDILTISRIFKIISICPTPSFWGQTWSTVQHCSRFFPIGQGLIQTLARLKPCCSITILKSLLSTKIEVKRSIYKLAGNCKPTQKFLKLVLLLFNIFSFSCQGMRTSDKTGKALLFFIHINYIQNIFIHVLDDVLILLRGI